MCDSRSVPKVFISLRLLLLRYESHIQNSTFPFLFVFFHSETKDTSKLNQKRKTHPVLFWKEGYILYPNYTLPVFQNNSVWGWKVSFFKMVHIFSFISLISEYVLKTQTIPFLFLVFHFEAKRHFFSHSITSFSFIFIYRCHIIFLNIKNHQHHFIF
jgi:hypothetical protein